MDGLIDGLGIYSRLLVDFDFGFRFELWLIVKVIFRIGKC